MTRAQTHPHQTTVISNLKIIPLTLGWLLKFALLIIIIAVFTPLSPKMPAPGLDASWAVGLNQAVAQGLAFGKDIFYLRALFFHLYKILPPCYQFYDGWGKFVFGFMLLDSYYSFNARH